MAVRELEVQQLGRAIGRRWPPLVRELAVLDTFPDRVVSLYLDVCWNDEQQRERARLSIKDQLRKLRAMIGEYEAAESVAQDLRRVEEYVEERTHVNGEPNVRGEAVFLCAARGFDRGVRSTYRFPNLAVFGPTPSLRPLIAALPTSGRVLCALSDNAKTKLYQLASDASGALAYVEGAIPRRHHQGGWSQLKLQHWRLEEVGRFHKQAADWIQKFLVEEEHSRVLLGGRPEALTGMLSHLPNEVKQRLRVVPGIAQSGTWGAEAETLAQFSRALAEIEREEAEQRLTNAIDSAGAGMRGAVGVEGVVAAINEGRCGELLIADALCRDGWRCARCRVIGDGEGDTCTACGGPAEPLELGEALVHAAVLQDAGVTIIPSPSRLDLNDGLAAQLRF